MLDRLRRVPRLLPGRVPGSLAELAEVLRSNGEDLVVLREGSVVELEEGTDGLIADGGLVMDAQADDPCRQLVGLPELRAVRLRRVRWARSDTDRVAELLSGVHVDLVGEKVGDAAA